MRETIMQPLAWEIVGKVGVLAAFLASCRKAVGRIAARASPMLGFFMIAMSGRNGGLIARCGLDAPGRGRLTGSRLAASYLLVRRRRIRAS